jgi:hypothetical protein
MRVRARVRTRMRAPGVLALGLPAALVAVAVGLVLARPGPADNGGPRARPSFSLEDARAFDEFLLFYAGPSVDGLPLTAVLRRDDTASFVSFVYGDCDASGDAGCAPPAEIQVWPSCVRSLALYDVASGSPAPDWVEVRGVRGALFDRGTRLELGTGRSLVVVFADSRTGVLRIAAGLRAVDGSVDAGAPLPPAPAPPAAEEGGAMGC